MSFWTQQRLALAAPGAERKVIERCSRHEWFGPAFQVLDGDVGEVLREVVSYPVGFLDDAG